MWWMMSGCSVLTPFLTFYPFLSHFGAADEDHVDLISLQAEMIKV
jgi:hypothetical protein